MTPAHIPEGPERASAHLRNALQLLQGVLDDLDADSIVALRAREEDLRAIGARLGEALRVMGELRGHATTQAGEFLRAAVRERL